VVTAAPELSGEEQNPAPARLRAVKALLVGGLAVACWVVAHHVPYPPFHGLFDLQVYRGAATWWADGHPLYSYVLGDTGYGFTYPPFAAVLMRPLAWVSFSTAATVHTTVNVLLAGAAAWWLFAPVARRAGWSPWFVTGLAVPVVLLMEPIRETLGFGQVNLFIGALIAADVIALRRGWAWAGAGTGLATAVKLTPAVFVLYLLLTRRWRPAAVAVGTGLAASALTYAVAPGTSSQFWLHTLWASDRVGLPDQISNQSLLGVLARISYPDPPDHLLWAALSLGVLVLGMARACRAQRHGDELVGVTLAGIVSCLVSPITWTHHLYWVVPAIAVLLDVAVGAPVAGRTRSAPRWPSWLVPELAGVAAAVSTAALCGGVLWHFGDPGRMQPHQEHLLGRLGEDSYAILLVVLLLVLPVRAARTGPVEPPDRADRCLAAPA
jgi:alpha-1,2-mannosyltransferase